MEDKKITIKDIAALAGVSKSTISRYFNQGYVKEETREKIEKIIKDHNYQPNAFAQSLKAKDSKLIGVIAPTLSSVTSSRMLMALDGKLKQEGYTPLIINTDHNQLDELESINKLWNMNVAGIVLLATKITMAHRSLASKLNIPLIFLAQRIDEGVSIINDDYNAGREIGKYAGEMGHKDIIYLGVSNDDEAVGQIRKNGVLESLQEAGISYVKVVETDFSFDETRKVVRELLDTKIPTLFICATDNIALATYKELIDKGIKVPEEVSLIGFGGYETCKLITPSLCSVRFNNEKAGRLTGETMLKMIKGEPVRQLQTIDFTIDYGGSVKNLRGCNE